jgi:serine/threonine protein kinase
MAGERRNALPNGYQFEGYRIDRVLGAGGFGMTYRATEVALGRSVAIKEFLPGGIVMRDADRVSVHALGPSEQRDFDWGLDSFRKEAATLVTFRHPNIVTVYR